MYYYFWFMIYSKVWKKGNSRQSCRLPVSTSQEVDFDYEYIRGFEAKIWTDEKVV
jgi:hypothetical protein